jgi:hypothetical protein
MTRVELGRLYAQLADASQHLRRAIPMVRAAGALAGTRPFRERRKSRYAGRR